MFYNINTLDSPLPNLAQSMLNMLTTTPDRIALIEANGQQWSRGQLLSATNAFARHLMGLGLVRGDRVVIQVPPGGALIVATLAVIGLGAVPVLLEGGLGDDLYLGRIAAAAPSWLIAHPALVALDHARPLRGLARRLGLPPLPPCPRKVLLSNRSLAQMDAQTAFGPFPLVEVADADPCLVVYTGGSTQAPKGVMHTHGSLRAFLGAIREVGGLEGVERMVVDTLPQALYALYLGLQAHLATGRGRAARVLERLQSGQAQGYFGAPYLWREMMRLAPNQRLPVSVRWVLLGSAPVRPRFLRQLEGFLHPDTAVWSLYGMTEAGPVCVASLAEKLAWAGEGDFVGRPILGMQVAVEGEGVGEVLLRGPSVCPGYLGETPRAPDAPLRTGDLGQWVDGPGGRALVLHGRKKEMVIRRGVNIYPGTLEGPLLQAMLRRGLPVDDCALIGEWDEQAQDERLALVVAGPSDLDLTAVAAVARTAAGPDGQPDRLLRLDALPVKGRQNKRDLAALRALLRSDQPQGGRWLPFGGRDLRARTVLRLGAGAGVGRVLGELVLRAGLYGLSQLTWALDDWVAPRWREAKGRGPLFIIGHQRSGTTALHRLLAQDAAHARALTLAEMLLPAISAAPLIAGVGRLDRALGGALGRLEDRLFSPMDPIHRIRLGEVEEDEFVLWAVFASIMVANDDPWLVEHRHLDHLRQPFGVSEARRQQVLGFYRDVLTRRLYRDGATSAASRWMVAKNPAFTQKIPDLARLFPDARFIYLIRHPIEAIRSRLSLLREVWRRRFPATPTLTPAQTAVIIEDSVRCYLAAERDLPLLPPDRRLVIRHRDLHAAPAMILQEIYAHFQLPGPPPTPAPAPPIRSLSANDIDFDPEPIRRDLAVVFERYGF